MTATFSAAPSFLSKITADQADASIYSPYGSSSSQCFMIGEDRNMYYSLYPFHTGANPNNEAIGCANTGAVILLDSVRLTTDGAISAGQNYVMIPCAGTKYFWVLGIDSTSRVTWLYSGCLYKIINDTTVAKAGSFPQFETQGPLHPAGPFPGGFFIDGDLPSIQMNKTLDRVYFASKLSTFNGSAGNKPTMIMSLPVVEGGGDPSGWASYSLLTDNFFNYAFSTSNYQAMTLVPDASTLGYHYLLTIRKADYAYMVANPGDSTSYSLFTGPGIYMWRPDTGAVTNVTSLFGITDFGTHLDGSSSTDVKDDYVGCSTFFYNNQQYVCFNRSYSLEADLNTAGHGTYVHTLIFDWDSEVAENVFEDHSYLFDTVTDTGGSPATAYAPTFVQVGLVGNDLFYLWGNQPLPSRDAYVVGSLIHIVPDIIGAWRSYFSALKNPDYVDWEVIDNIGADFISELYIYFMLSSETSLFMQAPWIVTYLDNTQTNPACLMTPSWEWTDTTTNHKSGPTLDIYRVRTKSAVSDLRTRIRGKGRALQLHFKSSTGQPFNLLGWSVKLDTTSQP